MKNIGLIIVFGITFFTVRVLNNGIRDLPPFGKILDPFHGFWQNAESKKIGISKTSLPLKGIKQEVSIFFDENMIPQITAQNDNDLYFAQGYVTAMQRLWQMDFQSYIAAGRVSEVVGLKALNFDILQRRKGLVYTANRIVTNLKDNSDYYEIVQSYTNGINAYIESLDYKHLPIEYKLLNYYPELFTIQKVALVLTLMIDDLCSGSVGIKNSRSYDFLKENKEKFDFLFSNQNEVPDTVIPKNTPWHFDPIVAKQPACFEISDVIGLTNTSSQQKFADYIPGSNNWALNNTKTKDKAIYLANDPHLTLSLPSIWHGVHLKSPTVNVFGAAVPGIPGVLVGFNDHIAWGITNASIDVKSWYKIDFIDDSRKEYMYDELYLKSQSILEEIKIKGQKSFFDEVIYTHLGPIVYDEKFKHTYFKNLNLAMKWMGHIPGRELFGIHLLNRVKNLDEFKESMSYYNVPIISLAFASVENDIAMSICGQLPLRWKNQGLFIMSGNNSNYEWGGLIPKQHNPMVVNPTLGYISSANQRVTDASYPYYYHHYAEENYRNRRINQILSSSNKFDETMLMKLQNDNYNLMARDNLSMLMEHLNIDKLSDSAKHALETLKTWNFYNEIALTAPSIFKAWQKSIMKSMWKEFGSQDDFKTPTSQRTTPTIHRTMEIIKQNPNSPYINLGEFATISDLISNAFEEAVNKLLKWEKKYNKPYTWGNYRKLDINHTLRISSFGLHNLKVGGGKNTINANEYEAGASMRMVVKLLDNKVRGWFIYPGGQSGNPGSPYYTNMVEAWENGKYIQISIDRDLTNSYSMCIMLLPNSSK